jgi:hypothetical protein
VVEITNGGGGESLLEAGSSSGPGSGRWRTQQAGVGNMTSYTQHQVQCTGYCSMVEIASRGGGETLLEGLYPVDWVLGCGEHETEWGWVI